MKNKNNIADMKNKNNVSKLKKQSEEKCGNNKVRKNVETIK